MWMSKVAMIITSTVYPKCVKCRAATRPSAVRQLLLS